MEKPQKREKWKQMEELYKAVGRTMQMCQCLAAISEAHMCRWELHIIIRLIQMHFQIDADEPIVLQGIVTC